jgi:hypothetical protein
VELIMNNEVKRDYINYDIGYVECSSSQLPLDPPSNERVDHR